MRVLYITSSLPFGVGEPFLYPEIRAIKDLGVDLKVVPLYPRGTLVHPEAKAVITMVEAAPLFSWRILQVALRVLLRFPKRALQALLLLLTPNPWHLLKNLTVFPKALWLADLAMSWRPITSTPTGRPPPHPWPWQQATFREYPGALRLTAGTWWRTTFSTGKRGMPASSGVFRRKPSLWPLKGEFQRRRYLCSIWVFPFPPFLS